MDWGNLNCLALTGWSGWMVWLESVTGECDWRVWQEGLGMAGGSVYRPCWSSDFVKLLGDRFGAQRKVLANQ